jgi:STE24 endopeptidase
VNEPKSSRYHRLSRRAELVSWVGTAGLLLAMLQLQPPLPIALYVLVLAALHELITLPSAFYRTFTLEHRYELSAAPVSAWLRDHAKASGIGAVFAVLAGQVVYGLIEWSPDWWWLAAAVAGTKTAIGVARLAPVLLLPLFYRFRPLERPGLNARLIDLSNRAGVPVLGVFEWGLGARSRRANAALVGSGGTRRILLSDTMLAEYGEDEIEVVLAHELAHHVHHDIAKSIAVEFALLLAACYAASLTLDRLWKPLGLDGPADPAGLPLLLLAAGAVTFAATPLLNAFSRSNETRADDFAIALTGQREAFVRAMRRLAAQNLAEESPSRAALWLFHTHPPIEQRIAQARAGEPQVGGVI